MKVHNADLFIHLFSYLFVCLFVYLFIYLNLCIGRIVEVSIPSTSVWRELHM